MKMEKIRLDRISSLFFGFMIGFSVASLVWILLVNRIEKVRQKEIDYIIEKHLNEQE